MKKLVLLFLFLGSWVGAQSVQVHLSQQDSLRFALLGYQGWETEVFATGQTDSLGMLNLKYPPNYTGVGILESEDGGSLLLFLGEPFTTLYGTSLQQPESFRFENSPSNSAYRRYAQRQEQRDFALSAWNYLLPLYQESELLATQDSLMGHIRQEQARLKAEDLVDQQALASRAYLAHYIPLRRWLTDMPRSLQQNRQQIPELILAFRTFDWTQPYTLSSGLLKEALEGHYLFIESSGMDLPDAYVEMNTSTDYLLDNLKSNPALWAATVEKIYLLMESRSWFTAAQHLALRALTTYPNLLTPKLASQLESYRSLAVGSTAPDLQLNPKKKLSDSKRSTLLVFGSPECSSCVAELPHLDAQAKALRKQDIDIVYIAFDTDEAAYDTHFAKRPWDTYTDLPQDQLEAYRIVVTPTLFLVDADLKIRMRPKSVAHLMSWLEVQ